MAERQSLNKTLEQRYAEQTTGGAFNAKIAGTDQIPPTPNVTLEDKYKKQSSIYVNGLDTTPYSH